MSDRIERWEEWATTQRNFSPNTVRLYRRTLQVVEAELGELSGLTTQQIRGWLLEKAGAPGTFSNRLSALRSFYRFQIKAELSEVDPTLTIDSPKQPKHLPKPIEDLEAALKLLDEADDRANYKGPIPRRVGETRDLALFLCYTGLRIHEAVALELPVPCPDTLRVRGKGRKDAIIPVHPKAREAWDRLGGQWGHGKDGKPIGARATQRRFERAFFSPHQCRHYLGTAMASAGCDLGDIKAQLRHESMQTTLGYAAWATDRTRAALDKVG